MTTLLRCGLRRQPLALVTAIVGMLCLAPFLAADQIAPGSLGAGATFETLQVGPSKTYRQVKVRSVNARTLLISHAGGLASVGLHELSPQLQAAFGYTAEAAAAADLALKNAQRASDRRRLKEHEAKTNPKTVPAPNSSFETLLQSFGKAPEIHRSVDLRPKFQELALNVKNQGARPSCAVFAVVSALEYQNAQITGEAERFSEEYLIWATCRTLNRPFLPKPGPPAGGDAATEDFDGVDAGFALSEVVTALRAYGVPPQARLPYAFGNSMDVSEPPREIVDEARSRRRVSVFSLPGHDQATRLANLIHALDAGVPVAVGISWPPSRSIRGGYLTTQRPLEGTGHAVTLVGYENKTGEIRDTVFIFKNSWGMRWGAAGYGFASYEYLINNLAETALLEIEPPAPSRG
ncbi:MAG TPA: C1 family peptidase [Opitutaceae bacterium]|nr:C1 family peptidase [Opitutaceae bacterium]